MAATAAADEVHRVVSVALDAAFYRAVYPDVVAEGADPLRHYLEHGWKQGRDPAPWFSTQAYLDDHPDVRGTKVDPFFHYLMHGRREGRDVRPSAKGEAYLLSPASRGGWRFDAGRARPDAAEPEPLGPSPEQLAAERALIAPEFEIEFYLQANGDVAEAGQDPLEHFLITGWLEGRDPNPRFSVRDYLETYPDIAAAGVNPFVHYLRAGRAEGRRPRSDLGFRYQLLADLRPVAVRTAEVAARAAVRKPAPPARLAEAFAASRSGLKDLHVTFSHDDYSANLGGVQLCLQREDARVAALGRDHLHLYPADPWPVTRQAREPGLLGVLWNGERVGLFKPKAVASALAAAAPNPGGQRTFAIHSLLGHSPDETADILAAAGLRSGWFWLHDFASLCAGYHLLRNDVQDCAAPPPGSPACNVCSYFSHRQRHIQAHRRLFERLDLTVVAPSQPTLDLWLASGLHAGARTVVLPHAMLADRGPAPTTQGRPLRVAYAGMPSAHKGWELFRDLVLRYEADGRYTFLHLGSRTIPGLPLEFHPVAVTEDRPRVMQETLEGLDVDVVLVWPLCRETFSFIAYEAVAAGCAVVTGPDSGNVQAFVREGGHGRVLPDEAALVQAFEDGAIRELARAVRKPRLYDLEFSNLTVDLFEGAAIGTQARS